MYILKRKNLKRKSKPYLRNRASENRLWFTKYIDLAGHFLGYETSYVIEAKLDKLGIPYKRVPVVKTKQGMWKVIF